MVAVGLLAALLLLTGRTGATDSYYAIYDNVSGVSYGTPVRFEGYNVGQVEGVEPVSRDGAVRFRVELAVREGFPIPADSKAAIASAGLLSGSAIAISRGTADSNVEPGAMLATAPSRSITGAVADLAGTVDQLSEKGVQPLMTKLTRAADQLDTLLRGPAKRIAGNLERTSGVAAEVSERLDEDMASPENLARIRRALAHMEGAAETLDRQVLSADNARQLDTTLRNLKGFSTEARDLTQQLRSTSTRVDKLVRRIDTLTEKNSGDISASVQDLRYSMATVARRIDAITYNLENTSRNMHEFARQIRRKPSLLLRGGTPAEAAE